MENKENIPKFDVVLSHLVIEIDYDENGPCFFNCSGDPYGLHDLSDEAYDEIKSWLDTYIDYACNRGDLYDE